MILISEAELTELRLKATEPDARLKDMIDANKEAERYAGKMERALERVLAVCQLVKNARHSHDTVLAGERDAFAALDIIEGLAMVKDDRKRIAPYAPNKQG